MISPVHHVRRTMWRGEDLVAGERTIPEEVAVAISYDGSSYAVMMATPQDLVDFAIGFSLTEGVVKSPDDIRSVEIIEEDIGIEARMWLAEPRAVALRDRRRYLTGPTGCGLCGIESLAEAMRSQDGVCDNASFTPDEIMAAVEAVGARQVLNEQTRAVHGVAFWTRDEGIVAVREDVGRHNALDKLVGALARAGRTGAGGIGVLTSRISVEMVQKAIAARIPVIAAVSAPTALAVRTAEAAGITLVGIARRDGFEIFTHAGRIRKEQHADAS